MICALKLPRNSGCLVDIPKAVFSYWPLFWEGLVYRTTVANISITFRNQVSSPSNLMGALLLFPQGHIDGGNVYSITETLIDECNPLSISYTGLYKKGSTPYSLLKYDGVDNVFVDCQAKVHCYKIVHPPFDIIRVIFSNPIIPGFCVAVRLLYYASTLFDIGTDKSMHFTQLFLDIRRLHKHFSESKLRTLEIPILTNYDSEENGGFDVFYYMPLELSGEEFEHHPHSRLRPRYDFLGRPTTAPFKKYSWQARRVLGILPNAPTALHIGEGFVLTGVFCPRNYKGVTIVGDIKNKEGILIINSSVDQSSLTVTTNKNNVDIEVLVDKILTFAKDLEVQLADKTAISEEKSALIKPYVDAIKAQAVTKNKNLLRIALDGLRETLRYAGDIAPSIVKTIEGIKELF